MTVLEDHWDASDVGADARTAVSLLGSYYEYVVVVSCLGVYATREKFPIS